MIDLNDIKAAGAPSNTPRAIGRRGLLRAVLPLAAGRAPDPSGRPNVLLFLSDDHSRPHLGCYGDPLVRTPNLDRFAAEGARFERSYSTAPQCSPSRGSIFTGMAPQRLSMTRLGAPLPPEFPIFPEVLRQAGYFTGVTCRWHHIDGPPTPTPEGRFLERHGLATMARRVDHLEWSEDRTQTPAIVNRFFDRAPKSQPFFLQVSSVDPHRPYHERLLDQPHDPGRVVVPPYLPDLPEVRADLARYYDAVTRMDMEFGSVLEILRERGLEDNTLAIFMGDNGYAFPHGKGTLYQPGWSVPLLVKWPGHVRPGLVIPNLVSGSDLAPSILEAAGLRPSPAMEGRSFLNALRGRPHRPRRYVFGARGWHGNLDLIRAVSSSTHSLIYNGLPELPPRPLGDYAGEPIWHSILQANAGHRLNPAQRRLYFAQRRSPFELYDLRTDPHELENLAGRPEHATVEQALKQALNDWMTLNYDVLAPPFAD